MTCMPGPLQTSIWLVLPLLLFAALFFSLPISFHLITVERYYFLNFIYMTSSFQSEPISCWSLYVSTIDLNASDAIFNLSVLVEVRLPITCSRSNCFAASPASVTQL